MSYNDVKTFLKECKKPEKYNFEYECDIEEYLNLNPFARYFTYRATAPASKYTVYNSGEKFAKELQKKGSPFIQLADCDGSGETGNNALIHNIYFKLWNWERIWEWGSKNKPELSTFGNVNGSKFGCCFGGETINSPQITLDEIVKYKIGLDDFKGLRKKLKGNVSIKYMISLYSEDKTETNELIKMLNDIQELVDYVNAYHSIGNFVLVPAYFNKGRGGFSLKIKNEQLKDYWDLSLEYLRENGWKNTFNYEGKNLNDYYRYINYFFLWDYVDENGIPIELLDREKNNTDILENSKQFLKKAVKIIQRRGSFMVAMLKLRESLGEELYTELRNNVFIKDNGVYKDYDEVYSAIEEFLNTKRSEIEKIF